jgi:hypothetical protein
MENVVLTPAASMEFFTAQTMKETIKNLQSLLTILIQKTVMKRILLLSIAFFSFQFVSAQMASDVTMVDNEIYVNVERHPNFPGGMRHFYNYLVENINADKLDKPGEIVVQFVIEKDGTLSRIKVLKDLGNGSGEEAIRVLKKGPHWIPGEQNGQKVRVLHVLPIKI